jgi:hypothetical protein
MEKLGFGSARSFAFAAVLTRVADGAAGCVTFTPGSAADDAGPALEYFATILAARQPLRWSGGGGGWKLEWR